MEKARVPIQLFCLCVSTDSTTPQRDQRASPYWTRAVGFVPSLLCPQGQAEQHVTRGQLLDLTKSCEGHKGPSRSVACKQEPGDDPAGRPSALRSRRRAKGPAGLALASLCASSEPFLSSCPAVSAWRGLCMGLGLRDVWSKVCLLSAFSASPSHLPGAGWAPAHSSCTHCSCLSQNKAGHGGSQLSPRALCKVLLPTRHPAHSCPRARLADRPL